jgi:hypothetical protein
MGTAADRSMAYRQRRQLGLRRSVTLEGSSVDDLKAPLHRLKAIAEPIEADRVL